MKTKPCEQCGKSFQKPYFESLKNWEERHKFCSRACSSEAMIGKPLSTSRKEQNRIWSTGKKHTPEAIAKMSGDNCHLWKGGKPRCVDCGTALENRYAKRCVPCYRLTNSGEGAPNWQGGLTTENAKIRNSPEMKLWRLAVFTRDGYTCVLCGKHGVTLEADHIKPFSLFKDLRFSEGNGRTLCVPCHKSTETYGCKLKKTAPVIKAASV